MPSPNKYALFVKKHFHSVAKKLGPDAKATVVMKHVAKLWHARSKSPSRRSCRHTKKSPCIRRSACQWTKRYTRKSGTRVAGHCGRVAKRA